MSETGFTKLTAFLRGDGAGGKASGGNESRILTLPAALRAEASTLRAGLRLRGEVVSQNPDSSVSVRTERGVVDIIPPKNRSLPTKGTEVEINIAPQRGGREETPRAELRIIRQAESSRGNTTPVEVNVESGRRPEQTQLSRSQQETSNALSRAKAQLERMTGAQTKPTPAKDVAPAPDVSSEKVPKQANTAQAQNSSASTQKVSEALKAFYTQGLPDVGDLVRLIPTKAGPLPTVALAPALNTALNVPPAQTFASISPQAGKGGLLTAQTQMQVPQIHFLQIQNPQGEQLTQNFIFDFQGAELKIKNLIQMGYISPKQDTAIQPPESIKPLQQTLGNINADRPIKALTGQAEAKGFFAKLITPPTTEGLLTTESTPLFAPLKTMDVRINGITPPKMVVKNIAQSQAQNQILGNFKAGQIEGVVTGLSEAKLPQLSLFLPQTGETAMFDLQKPALDGVTIGARLQVTPQNSGLSALSAPSSSPDLMPLPALTAPSSSWPILDEVQQTLAHIVPQAAAAMANTVPSPASPAQMMPAMMFFISAVRGGDLQSWLGEKSVEALSKSSKGLLERLSGESSTLSRVASDSAQGDWRIFNIPIMYQEQIQKMALYYRHEDSEDTDAPKGAKGTRFVFDLALDNMGAVQVDGLFRPISSDGKRLDLVVRTETPFSKATRAEMRRVYTLALRHTEVGGELSFQNQSSQWVSVGIAPDAGLGVNA